MSVLCPRCMGASLIDLWDDVPEGGRLKKCMSCSHQFEAEPVASATVKKEEVMPRFNSPEAEQRWREAVTAAAEKKRKGTGFHKAQKPKAPTVEAEEVPAPRLVRLASRGGGSKNSSAALAVLDAAAEQLVSDQHIIAKAREIIERLSV